ncbi:MAG: hypothetical protein ACXWCH_33685 [Burkholderiales bacterium]
METHEAFESLARPFLARNPSIRHEWRQIPNIVWGDRTDLICEPSTEHEVWATLRDTAITIGTADDHVDFEDFGRGLSDEELAREAFAYFTGLLVKRGIIET